MFKIKQIHVMMDNPKLMSYYINTIFSEGKKKKTLATEETEIYLKVSRNRKNSPK